MAKLSEINPHFAELGIDADVDWRIELADEPEDIEDLLEDVDQPTPQYVKDMLGFDPDELWKDSNE